MKRVVSLCGVALLFFTSCGPAGPDDRQGRDTFGSVLYEIIEATVDQGDCPAVRGPILREARETLIRDLDVVFSPEARTVVPEFVKDRLRPLVNSGQLPALTDALRDQVRVLQDRTLDPMRRTPAAIARFDPGDVAGHHAVSFMSEMLDEEGLEPRVHDFVRFLLERDPQGRALDRVVGFAHRQLERYNALPTCAGSVPFSELSAAEGERSLLSSNGFVAPSGTTMRRFAVRANAKGWPLGRAVAPFRDSDRNGVADVDGEGRPIDMTGAPVDLEAFGWNTPYDELGVARNPQAEAIYRYFGIDETALWHLYRAGHRALSDGLHDRALRVAKAALGETSPCPGGEAGCQVYSSQNHPIADLTHLAFEAMRSPRAQDLVSGFSALVRQKKDVAEPLVAVAAQAGEALLDNRVSLISPDTLDFASSALDLFAQLETPGQTTPLVGELLAMLHGVHRSGVDLRAIAVRSMAYSSLVKNPTCGPQGPDLAASTRVDYSQPRRTATGGDNRSALEKAADTFAVLDCGNVPLLYGGRVVRGTIAEHVVGIGATLQPNQACQLVTTLEQLLNLASAAGFGGLSEQFLSAVGCTDSTRVLAAVGEMRSLAATGALDVLIPTARVFVARNKVRPMIDGVKFMANDFAKDDDANTTTRSVVRDLLPTLTTIVEDPKSEAMFQLVDFLGETRLPNRSTTLADDLAVAVTELFETKTVKTRQGSVPSTSLARQALAPFRILASRIHNTPAHQEAVSIARSVLSTAFARQPGGMALEDPNVVPFLGAMSSAELVDTRLSAAERTCTIDRGQKLFTDFLTSQDLPGGLSLLEDLTEASSVKNLTGWLTEKLDPARPDGAAPATKLLLTTAAVLQEARDPADITIIARQLEALLERDRGGFAAVLDTVDTLVTNDRERFVLPALRRLFAGRTGPDKAPPYENISDLVSRLASIRTDDACRDDGQGFDAADVEATLDGAVDLLDRSEGKFLGKVYQLISEQP